MALFMSKTPQETRRYAIIRTFVNKSYVAVVRIKSHHIDESSRVAEAVEKISTSCIDRCMIDMPACSMLCR